MKTLCGLAAVALGVVSICRPVAAASGEGLAGRWQGTVVESSLAGAPAAMRADIGFEQDAITARWTRLGGGEALARLEPTSKRPAVLMQKKQGLSAMLGRDRPVDPLQGEPLFWGRLAGDSLTLYELTVARDGALALDRYHLTPTGPDELQLEASRVGPAGEPLGNLHARLRRDSR